MNSPSKKEISDALREAMNREEINTRAAAAALNLNPCYISMCLNPNSWDSMAKAAWERIEEWFYTRDLLELFSIPEGEEIWKPKEKEEGQKGRKGEEEKEEKSGERKAESEDKREGKNVVKKAVPHDSFLKIKEEKAAFAEGKKEVDELVKKHIPQIPTHSIAAPQFTDAVRIKVALDIEINLIVNGQKVRIS